MDNFVSVKGPDLTTLCMCKGICQLGDSCRTWAPKGEFLTFNIFTAGLSNLQPKRVYLVACRLLSSHCFLSSILCCCRGLWASSSSGFYFPSSLPRVRWPGPQGPESTQQGVQRVCTVGWKRKGAFTASGICSPLLSRS